MKKNLCCMLIDDDPDEKVFFDFALNHIDPEIKLYYSSSGASAIKHLKAGDYTPDYIFLDLNMRPMTGVETLIGIKKISACTEIPVIIYSTRINENIKYNTLALGAFDHFEKPLLLSELEVYLKRLFQTD